MRDLASALELLAEKGEAGGVYNISGGRTYQIRELVERVVAAARVPIAVETDPALLRPSDEKVIFGDSGRLVARTGWKQQVDIATTLGDMIAYWRRMFGVEEGAA